MRGLSTTNLWYMVQFYNEYHEDENLQSLVGEISWTKHIVILSKCKDSQERQFYIGATKKFGWTKDGLIHQIENKSFEKYLLNQTNFDSAYNITPTLPAQYQNLLPSTEAIREKLLHFFEERNHSNE